MTISKGISSKVLRSVLYSLYLFLIVFILLEILLRIYNPFGFRLKADRIILPINQKQIIRNTINPRLDSIIINSRNGLGLRGPEKPADFGNKLSILMVGGSTTECHFLDDYKTWPYQLEQILKKDFTNVWLNNAGLDGHSTFGHQLLLNDYLVDIKPKVIVFLTGVNEIENDGPTFHDKLNKKGAFPDIFHYIYNESEVMNIVVNLIRGSRAQKFNNTTQELRLPGKNGIMKLTNEQIDNRIRNQDKYLKAYEGRIRGLIDTCKQHGILPVFCSQPTLYGEGIDSVTKADLANSALNDGMNGQLLWQLLQAYNKKMKQVCDENDIPFIDLASKMPKNSLYYYDQSHFTNEGAMIVAEIIAGDLKKLLKVYFPAHLIGTK